jgi:hypothetical protein
VAERELFPKTMPLSDVRRQLAGAGPRETHW